MPLNAYKRNIISCVVVLIALFASNKLIAQPLTSPVSLQHSTELDFCAKTNNQDYKLFVSLPASYNPKDSAKYPVVYLLDGNLFFSLVHSMKEFYLAGEEVPEMIVVGIGYHINTVMESMPYRTWDYTPTRDTSFDNMITAELKSNVVSGGANYFMNTLKSEIIPYVEQHYKTSNDKALAGHSFGALFGAYVLFHEPSLFNKYLLSSVSMPWDKDEMLSEETSYFNAGHKQLPARVFISVGEKEESNMVPLMQQLVKAMREHNYEGLNIEDHILANESHTSVVATAFNQGLRSLYKEYKRL